MQAVPVRPTKAYPKLCAEAASLITAPARLVALSQRDAPMGPLALRNPQLPAVLAPQPSQVGNPDKPREWFNRAARTSRMRREARRLLAQFGPDEVTR